MCSACNFFLNSLFYSRRLGDGSSSRDSSDDFSEVNRSSSAAATISQNLLVEIRQAVNEAQPKGRFNSLQRVIVRLRFGFVNLF